jgi:putative membrane protein
MKSDMKFATLLVLGLAFASCNSNNNNNEQQKDTKEIAEEKNEAKFDNAKEEDAKFLVTAAEINLEEIQLGDLAQKNSKNASVIALGKMMSTDHTKALNDLQALASKKQITIPASLTEDGQDAYKKLVDKKEDDFNKEYCDMMVKGHKKAIEKFETASKDAADPDIRAMATSMLPSLRMHLEHSQMCQDKLKK